MIVKNTDNTQFGWHYKMHADILRKSANLSNLPESIISAIEQAVQKPDFDEFFLYGQKHFYYPNDRIKSYLDYTKTHNAKYLLTSGNERMQNINELSIKKGHDIYENNDKMNNYHNNFYNCLS